jgi:hypothetical protein
MSRLPAKAAPAVHEPAPAPEPMAAPFPPHAIAPIIAPAGKRYLSSVSWL